MSRSHLSCLKCKSPLMARRHSGLFVLRPEVRIVRPVVNGLEVECPHCGKKRLIEAEDERKQAA